MCIACQNEHYFLILTEKFLLPLTVTRDYIYLFYAIWNQIQAGNSNGVESNTVTSLNIQPSVILHLVSTADYKVELYRISRSEEPT